MSQIQCERITKMTCGLISLILVDSEVRSV